MPSSKPVTYWLKSCCVSVRRSLQCPLTPFCLAALLTVAGAQRFEVRAMSLALCALAIAALEPCVRSLALHSSCCKRYPATLLGLSLPTHATDSPVSLRFAHRPRCRTCCGRTRCRTCARWPSGTTRPGSPSCSRTGRCGDATPFSLPCMSDLLGCALLWSGFGSTCCPAVCDVSERVPSRCLILSAP